MNPNLWKIPLLVLSWIIFPPAYIFMIARNKGLTKKKKRWAYGAALLSPISLIVLLIAIVVIHDNFFISNKFSRKHMERSLNITLVKPYNVDYNYIDQIDWQDFTATVIVSFEESSFKAVEQQIIDSKYYNLYQDFYGNHLEKWRQTDTILFREVCDYLRQNELTGYWVKEDSLTYKFLEPDLLDVPNSVLFGQGYVVQATLSREEMKLYFRYIQL